MIWSFYVSSTAPLCSAFSIAVLCNNLFYVSSGYWDLSIYIYIVSKAPNSSSKHLSYGHDTCAWRWRGEVRCQGITRKSDIDLVCLCVLGSRKRKVNHIWQWHVRRCVSISGMLFATGQNIRCINFFFSIKAIDPADRLGRMGNIMVSGGNLVMCQTAWKEIFLLEATKTL